MRALYLSLIDGCKAQRPLYNLGFKFLSYVLRWVQDPLKFLGVTKINCLKYSRVIHQKKRVEPLMIKQNSVLKNIEKCPSYG